MNPINGPRPCFITAISVFYVLRKDEKFIRAHFIPLVFYLVPAMTIHAIKDEIFSQSFFPVGKMPPGLWVITKAANIKRLQQLIVQYLRFQYGFRNLNSLPSGSMPNVFYGTIFGSCVHARVLGSVI